MVETWLVPGAGWGGFPTPFLLGLETTGVVRSVSLGEGLRWHRWRPVATALCGPCVVAWGPSVGAVRGAFGCGFGQVVVSVSAEVTAASKVAQEPLALPCALGDLSHPSPGTHLPLGARGLQIWGNQAAPEPGRTLSRPRRALDPGTCHPGRGQSCPRCVLGWPGQSSAGGQGAGPEGPSSPPAGASQASHLVSRQEHRP